MLLILYQIYWSDINTIPCVEVWVSTKYVDMADNIGVLPFSNTFNSGFSFVFAALFQAYFYYVWLIFICYVMLPKTHFHWMFTYSTHMVYNSVEQNNIKPNNKRIIIKMNWPNTLHSIRVFSIEAVTVLLIVNI